MAGRTAVLVLVGMFVSLLTGGAALAQESGHKALLESLKLEPTCPEVQKEALGYFNIDKEAVLSFRKGAQLKALAPVLEISGGYAYADTDEATKQDPLYPYEKFGYWLEKYAAGYGWELRGKLAWNFPQLVFNAEVLDVASLAGLVQGILKEVTRLYYMRRRLQLDLILNPPADEATRLTKELRLDELTALLDAMTGGYFQRELSRRGLTSVPTRATHGGDPDVPKQDDLFN